MGYKKWTTEDFTRLTELVEEGHTAKQISVIMRASESSIKTYRSKLGLSSKSESKHYTNEELIQILKDYPNPTSDKFKLDSSVPDPSTYARHFGSWVKAMELAGLELNIGTLKEDKPTKVYLVEFIDEGYYKVGITQRSIAERFSGCPKYNILLSLEMTLAEAKILEATWLKNVEEYKIVPEFVHPERRGSTECFKI